MNHLNFLFIVKSRDFDPAVHHTCMESAFDNDLSTGSAPLNRRAKWPGAKCKTACS